MSFEHEPLYMSYMCASHLLNVSECLLCFFMQNFSPLKISREIEK